MGKYKGALIALPTIVILFIAIIFHSTQVHAETATLKTALSGLIGLPSVIEKTNMPSIADPDWLNPVIVVTYSVATRGVITANFAEFQSQANETLNDSRGWSQMDIRFVQVASGGSFTLILSQASYLPSFSSGCSVDWSCRAGNSVIINQDRWLGATSAWNSAGGSLRDYRHMVVNHEVGHWLGHSHQSCSGAGQLAPIMQQQSINLQGCSFNPWPLASEMWSTRFGI